MPESTAASLTYCSWVLSSTLTGCEWLKEAGFSAVLWKGQTELQVLSTTTCVKEAGAVGVMNSLIRTVFENSPSESILDLCEWLNNVVVCRWRGGRGGWGKEVFFRDIINCPNKWSEPHQPKCNVGCARSGTPGALQITTHIGWLDFSWQRFLLLAAANGRGTNIYLDLHHFMRTDLSEAQPASASWRNHNHTDLIYFANSFFGWGVIIIWDDGWQVVHPQLQSINLSPHLLSLNSRPALLIKQRWLSGRISSAWRSPAGRPERREKKGSGVPDCRPCEVLFLK